MFASYLRERGETVPEFEYTKTQTSRTTIRYALDSLCPPIENDFLSDPIWLEAENDVYLKLRQVTQGRLLTADEIEGELNPDTSSGYPHIVNGLPLKKHVIQRAHEEGSNILDWSLEYLEHNFQFCWYFATMKKELVPKIKLIRRKQRML